MNSLHSLTMLAYRLGLASDAPALSRLIAQYLPLAHELLQAFGRGKRFARA